MFCYQPEITSPYYVAGVYNSKTEILTPEKFWQLLNDPQVEWLVNKHRAVRNRPDSPEWLDDEDFREFDRKMKAKPNSRASKTYLKLADDQKRVAAWCDNLKKRLPFAIFIGTYPMRKPTENSEEAMYRNQQYVQLNGLDVLDFDHVEGEIREVWERACEKLSQEDKERIVFVFVSPGGKGLKVVFEADPNLGNLIDNQIILSHRLGLTVDEACKDAARGTFLTTVNDIIYINEEKLFNYDNPEFAERYAEQYHRGNSQPTIDLSVYTPIFDTNAAGAPVPVAGATDDKGERKTDAAVETVEISYNGWSGDCQKIIDELYRETGLPGSQKGAKRKSRHTESLKLASDLLIVTGRNKNVVEKLLRAQPWVQAIIDERGEDVHKTVEDADASVRNKERKYGPEAKPSIAFMSAIKKLLTAVDTADGAIGGTLPIGEWGQRIEQLFDKFPCLREVCHGLPVQSYPAALFVSAAFLGTDMTRTWYYFYHRPEEQRRLNYCIMVIGDPASGKSFATRLYKLLAAPLIAADKVGNDAVNRYKQELKKRSSSSKEQKKDGLTEPDVTVRCLGSRTANGVFIKNMNKAVETVDGQPLHLHLLTFDSELDSATIAQRGGQWIDKSVMELKAFHNEQDDQQYANVDSMNGPFDVYWNYVYTGTPLSLGRKVTERNFGSGLSTRLAVIPMPPSDFKMMALSRVTKTDHAADEELKTWAFRLDGVKGELPLWPLVENVWQWANERLEIAEFNQDKADELLIKRVPYYGICIAAPFILMRHWDEWQEKKTFEIDDTDRELSTLAMDIQYAAQWHYFGEMAKSYFDNQRTREMNSRRRPSRYDYCYEQLPDEFTADDVVRVYGNNKTAAASICCRLKKQGFVESPQRAVFRKLKKTLL